MVGGLIITHLRGTGLLNCRSFTTCILRRGVTGGRGGMCSLLGGV